MKSLIVTLLILIVLHPSQGQKTQSLEGMNPGEIRKFLLVQNESDEAKEMIIKHNRSRNSAFVFFGSTVLLAIISNNAKNADEDHKDSILAAVGAWSCGLISFACTISASERMRKAKQAYSETIASSNEIGWIENGGMPINIRDEARVNRSIFH